MLYEKSRELAQLSTQNWLAKEVFSYGWFLTAFTLIAAYVLWGVLGDKSKAERQLLIGSLAAVAYSLDSVILGNQLGLAEYNIRLFPFSVTLFISSVTLAPIIIMLANQYAASWKGYMLRSGIGFAFLCLVIFPIFTAVGILSFHNWNVLYHFFVLFGISLVVRLGFLWIVGVQKRYLQKR